MTPNKHIIPYIHNYCDRWCEYCTHTRHCSVHHTETEMKQNDPEISDAGNEKFWNNLSQIFEATQQMLIEHANRLGIELPATGELPEPVSDNVDLEQAAKDYGLKLTKWLEANRDLFLKKSKIIEIIGIERLETFVKAVEVLNWYCYFIGAKIHRALLSFDADEDETDSYDKNGSAKIALIAINRSIEAMTVLYNEIPELEDDILRFLVSLSDLRKRMEAQFPTAMKFVRPGFDD